MVVNVKGGQKSIGCRSTLTALKRAVERLAQLPPKRSIRIPNSRKKEEEHGARNYLDCEYKVPSYNRDSDKICESSKKEHKNLPITAQRDTALT
ncbi:hypothetical protein TNCV_3977291 [Trichonephila clavipes]|nr:hypothetical protein TNCV_3977291 [Trichonephila clavipes]